MARSIGHVEHTTGILRIGGAYGEAFTWCASFRYLDPETVQIDGAIAAPTPSEWRRAVRVLKSHGVRTIRFTRKRGGRNELHTVQVK